MMKGSKGLLRLWRTSEQFGWVLK